jgi:hypothetical protein
MSRRQPEPRDREKELDDREETQAHGQAAQTTMQEAMRRRRDKEQFLERFRQVDVKGDDDENVVDEFGVELAGVYAVANEDDDDYRRHKWLDRNKRERFRAARNPGRLCRGPILELASGVHRRAEKNAPKPLSQAEERKVGEVMEAKTALHSLGKGGEGLSAVSEVTAVTEHRRETEPENESSGLISRIFS